MPNAVQAASDHRVSKAIKDLHVQNNFLQTFVDTALVQPNSTKSFVHQRFQNQWKSSSNAVSGNLDRLLFHMQVIEVEIKQEDLLHKSYQQRHRLRDPCDSFGGKGLEYRKHLLLMAYWFLVNQCQDAGNEKKPRVPSHKRKYGKMDLDRSSW